MNRIKELRGKNNLLQADLAKTLNVSRVTISRYETEEREMDTDTICRLCDYFGVTADYLLGRSSVPAAALSPEEEQLLLSWRAAPSEIRAIVDTALAPYRGNAGSKAG